MSELPLVDGVLRYINENRISLCMPGHKGGAGFLETDKGKLLYENFLKCDITEVDGVDNLHFPEGIIKEAQELLSKLYGSKKSYFLINGTTSGNLVMIFTAFNEGDKVLVERNCHRSISNGIILRKLKPIYIKNIVNPLYDAPMSVDVEHLLCMLKQNPDAKGIILTYPNYYGITTELKYIIEECRKRNMRVLVDSAHGAHFGMSQQLPMHAVAMGADMVVMSAHKTLPSLNQASFLHVNDERLIQKVNFYVNAFLSTSPSYMIMCSMDYARYYLQKEGRQAYDELLERADRYRRKINSIKYLHVLNQKDMTGIDLTRYVVSINKGYNADMVYEYLRENGIQPEMCDGRNIVLIFSPFNKENDFIKVYEALKSCPIERMKETYSKVVINDIPERVLDPHKTIDTSKLWIPIENSKKRICGEAVIPYPPGIPIITPGERVDDAVIDMIKYYLEKEKKVLGINDGKILVLEDTYEKGTTDNI